MSTLKHMSRDGSFTLWDEHFKSILFIMLETTADKDEDIRREALKLLRELCLCQASRFRDYAELTLLKILEAYKDPRFHNVAPRLLFAALGSIWPESKLLLFPNFLLTRGLYHHLEEYCQHAAPWKETGKFLRSFYRGLVDLEKGRKDRAFEHFKLVIPGVDLQDSLLRHQLFGADENPDNTETLISRNSEYFLRVANLFEMKCYSKEAAEMVALGLSQIDKKDKNLPKLLTLKFKNELRIGEYDRDIDAVLLNPDLNMQRNCLRQLLNTLVEEKKVKELVDLEYGRLENEAVELLQSCARTLDLDSMPVNYYDLLYTFFFKRGKKKNAASAMYELYERLRKDEGVDELAGRHGKNLKMQENALSIACNTLALVHEDYQWLTKINEDSDQNAENQERMIVILKLPEMKQELMICRAKNKLITAERRQSGARFPSALGSVSSSPEELVDQLLHHDLFDEATSLACGLDLSAMGIIRAVTLKCIQSIRLDEVLRSEVKMKGEEKVEMVWMEENGRFFTKSAWNLGTEEKCWKFLEGYIDCLRKKETHSRILKEALTLLLQYDWNLPNWLMDRFKREDIGECLKVLMEYGIRETEGSYNVDSRVH